MAKPIHVLGIAGSLRKASYNAGLLRAARDVLPADMTLEVFDLLPIPLYNGDVEAEGDPAPVQELKERIRAVNIRFDYRDWLEQWVVRWLSRGRGADGFRRDN